MDLLEEVEPAAIVRGETKKKPAMVLGGGVPYWAYQEVRGCRVSLSELVEKVLR